MPAYPPLAKAARVQGTVEFTAIISKEGVIEHLQLLRGHALLVQAARDAVLQWRYRPTLLNVLPAEVTTRILVDFTLAP
jgi:protein TonB